MVNREKRYDVRDLVLNGNTDPLSGPLERTCVALDDSIRDRVIQFGGQVVGVDCPGCEFESRDFDLDAHRITDVACPNCGETILTEDEKSELRRAGKL